jgi:hypothetical protein
MPMVEPDDKRLSAESSFALVTRAEPGSPAIRQATGSTSTGTHPRHHELVGMHCCDVVLTAGPHVRCHGKAASNAAPRSPNTASRSFAHGSPNATVNEPTHCSERRLPLETSLRPPG